MAMAVFCRTALVASLSSLSVSSVSAVSSAASQWKPVVGPLSGEFRFVNFFTSGVGAFFVFALFGCFLRFFFESVSVANAEILLWLRLECFLWRGE